MKTTELQPTAAPIAITGDMGRSDPPRPEQADVHWFAAELNQDGPAAGVATPAAPGLTSGLADALRRGGQQRKDAFEDLQKASRSSNILVLNQATEALSDTYVATLMNAKIVSKAVQSIDKLTNLQ